jgi:hypothetical protein
MAGLTVLDAEPGKLGTELVIMFRSLDRIAYIDIADIE